jgi:hypothetical protein
MSVLGESERLDRWYAGTRAARGTIERAVFGDGYGTALFLGSVCFFMLYWRIGVFITDNNAIATTLLNVADGRLHLTAAPYGSGLESPGTYVSGDRVYGRNYGVVFAALPFLWLLEGAATVADVRVVLVACWGLLVMGWAGTLARLFERRWLVAVGSVVAVATFLGSLTAATPLAPLARPVIALQLLTMVATALSGVVLYRLVARIHSRRVGLLAGASAMVATPLGFWASLPKRHTFTVLFLLVSGYALYRSRAAADGGDGDATTYRALAYGAVGLLAWVHAAEALVAFLVLVAVDVPTARSNDRRSLAVVGGVFLLSLVPFFLTNVLISGNPIEPPRLLTPYGEDPGTGLGSGGGGPSGGFFETTLVGQMLAKGISVLTALATQLFGGLLVLLTDGTRVYQTFVRSGYIAEVAADESGLAISLTILESAPLLAAIVGVPVAAARRLRSDGFGRLRAHLRTPAGTVDAFVVGSGLLFTLLYMTRLPLHAQVTVRYLHPLFAFGVYGIVRLAVVRETLTDHWRTGLWTYAGTVLIGGQLVIAYLALTGPTLGEAVQFHALLSLATATPLALWVVAAAASDAVPRSYGAVALALASAAGTLFLLLSGLDYFDYAGQYMLPVVRVVTDAVTLVA